MKSKLHLLAAVFVAAVCAGLLMLRKSRTPSVSPPPKPPASSGEAEVPAERAGDGRTTAATGLVDRLAAAKGPKELAEVSAGFRGAKLTEGELDRLREMARSGPQPRRRAAILILASLPDPDGKTLELLRETAATSDEFVRHAAIGAFRAYAQANPAAARDADAFLLACARSSADVESRLVAVAALDPAAIEATGLLRDADEEIRIAAIQHVSSAPLLAELYAADPSVRVKRELIARIRDRKTLESLKGLCRELDPEIDEALRDR